MKRWVILACLIPALVASGCALNGKPRHAAAVASQSVGAALFAVQDAELALYRTGKITFAQHRDFQPPLVKALKAGQAFNQVVLTWPAESKVAPPELYQAALAVQDLTTAIFNVFPASAQRDELMAVQNQVYRALVPFLVLWVSR